MIYQQEINLLTIARLIHQQSEDTNFELEAFLMEYNSMKREDLIKSLDSITINRRHGEDLRKILYEIQRVANYQKKLAQQLREILPTGTTSLGTPKTTTG